jgi:succinoglycan biosynthesis protein ExoA
MSTHARPFVSIVMPAYNEEPFIEACLRSLLSQTYPAESMEILVADGGSQDRTREIIERLAATEPRIRLLDNSARRIQSCGMNLAIKESRGEYILVTDVHAEYASDYVSNLVDVFLTTGADGAGGAQRARAQTRFQAALCAALTSPLGVGGAAYRSPDREGWVDTVFPGSFRRSILEKVGLYDTNAVTNEDAELFQRILEAAGRVYLSKSVVVHYYPRKSLSRLAKQYFKYGDGRARTLLLHGRLPVLRPVIPFAMLLTALVLLAVPPLHPLFLVAAGLYAGATFLEAVRVGSSVGLWAIPVVWAIFPTMHLAHALGMAQGLVKHVIRPRPPSIDRLDAPLSVPDSADRTAAPV